MRSVPELRPATHVRRFAQVYSSDLCLSLDSKFWRRALPSVLGPHLVVSELSVVSSSIHLDCVMSIFADILSRCFLDAIQVKSLHLCFMSDVCHESLECIPYLRLYRIAS